MSKITVISNNKTIQAVYKICHKFIIIWIIGWWWWWGRDGSPRDTINTTLHANLKEVSFWRMYSCVILGTFAHKSLPPTSYYFHYITYNPINKAVQTVVCHRFTSNLLVFHKTIIFCISSSTSHEYECVWMQHCRSIIIIYRLYCALHWSAYPKNVTKLPF